MTMKTLETLIEIAQLKKYFYYNGQFEHDRFEKWENDKMINLGIEYSGYSDIY